MSVASVAKFGWAVFAVLLFLVVFCYLFWRFCRYCRFLYGSDKSAINGAVHNDRLTHDGNRNNIYKIDIVDKKSFYTCMDGCQYCQVTSNGTANRSVVDSVSSSHIIATDKFIGSDQKFREDGKLLALFIYLICFYSLY